jgi:hypothetical protein
MPGLYRNWCLNEAIPAAKRVGDERNGEGVRQLNEAARYAFIFFVI